MSRSFTEPAFSRTATYRVKQLTSSTQNTFPFQNCHSCFGWKNTMSSAQIGGLLLLPLRLPRPWAPPTDTSPSSRCRRGEGQGHLRAAAARHSWPSSGGCHRTGWMNPTKNWLQHWWWSLVPSCLLPHQGLLLPRSLLLTSSLCREFGGTSIRVWRKLWNGEFELNLSFLQEFQNLLVNWQYYISYL